MKEVLSQAVSQQPSRRFLRTRLFLTTLALVGASCGSVSKPDPNDPGSYHDYQCSVGIFFCHSPSYDKSHPTPAPTIDPAQFQNNCPKGQVPNLLDNNKCVTVPGA